MKLKMAYYGYVRKDGTYNMVLVDTEAKTYSNWAETCSEDTTLIEAKASKDVDALRERCIKDGYREVKTEYICTDDTQWVKKTALYSFDLVEVRLVSPDKWIYVTGSIDLADYDAETTQSIISSYGYKTMDELRESYPNDWAQITAECIFEATPDVELLGFGPYNSEDKAVAEAEKYINGQAA